MASYPHRLYRYSDFAATEVRVPSLLLASSDYRLLWTRTPPLRQDGIYHLLQSRHVNSLHHHTKVGIVYRIPVCRPYW